MNSSLKTALIFGGLLIAVVGAAFLYSRSLENGAPGPARSDPAAAGAAPAVDLAPAIGAAVEAARAADYEEALRLFGTVPPTDPGYVVARRGYGSVQVELGRPLEAVDTFDALLAIAPEDAEVRVARSWALYHLGRYDRAEAETLRALEIAPQHPGARYNVAFFRIMQGRVAEAIPAYQRALRNDPEGRHMTRALEDLALVAQTRPDVHQVHYALAFFANTQGRTDTEVEELELFLEAVPTGPVAETARQRLAEASATLQ